MTAKFRAWDGEKMIENVVPFQWDFCIAVNHWRCIDHRKEWDYHPFFEVEGIPFKKLLQYTGRQLHGRDVCQDDIVEYHDATSPKGENGMRRVLVTWNNQRSRYDGIHSEGRIVGNIHQNPELMK